MALTQVPNSQRSISATTTDQHIALNMNGTRVVVTNLGPNLAYVGFGATSIGFNITSLNSMPILANSAYNFNYDALTMSFVAAITDAGGATVKCFNAFGD